MTTQTLPAQSPGIMINIDETYLDNLLEKEWLLCNQRGSYSSGTVLGCNTRRYHGLLVASLHPPVERMVTLSNLLEAVQVDGKRYELSNFEFSDRLHPQGYRFMKKFRRDNGVHFKFELPDIGLEIEKSIYLVHDQDILVISYDFSDCPGQVEFSLMPLLALRDFHSLQSSSTSLEVTQCQEIVTARTLDPHGPAVHLLCRDSDFERGTDWWYSMRYRVETRRGQHDYEDIWAPGHFRKIFTGSQRITFVVEATAGLERPGSMDFNVDDLIDTQRRRNSELIDCAQTQDDYEIMLTRAADQLIVKRQINETQISTSILAGYHWFADWGRDAFISLPGLLLSTGRLEEAREVLMTFGSVLDQGQIPNRFDDYGGQPHYNSVDASLWFINAAYQYLLASKDERTFQNHLRPMIAQIIAAYSQGTRDNIHADDDGLITAGDENTQLTWMDAKCNGVSFTPRYGKAVEINALWISALRIMAETSNGNDRQPYLEQAEKAEAGFRDLFWNPENNSLYDCVLPDGTRDQTIRPNQIFAVSLPFSPLSANQQASVLCTVEEYLLTPYGLRSLSPMDSRYQGHYYGDQFQRDSAYHQGTVWAFLMGPFIEAFLKVNHFSNQSKEQARKIIDPLLRHLEDSACLGSVSEIFDGDYPHYPKGCIAQAWSIAELLRCKKMLH